MKTLVLSLVAAAALSVTGTASAHEPARYGHQGGSYYGRNDYRHEQSRYGGHEYRPASTYDRYSYGYPAYRYIPAPVYGYAPAYGYQPGVSVGIVQPGFSLQFGFGR